MGSVNDFFEGILCINIVRNWLLENEQRVLKMYKEVGRKSSVRAVSDRVMTAKIQDLAMEEEMEEKA